ESEAKKPRPQPRLSKATTAQLVGYLAHDNLWWRLTAQRLLIERQAVDAAPALTKMAMIGDSAPARAHALWTLNGLGKLDDYLIVVALKDPEAGVREQA